MWHIHMVYIHVTRGFLKFQLFMVRYPRIVSWEHIFNQLKNLKIWSKQLSYQDFQSWIVPWKGPRPAEFFSLNIRWMPVGSVEV